MSTLSNRGRRGSAILIIVVVGAFIVPWNGFTLPVWLSEMHSGLILSRAATDAKVVALSFDDGPDSTYTPRVLEILKAYNVKATFFEQGRMIRLHPALARRVIAEGHVIGNHTETHPYIERLSRSGVQFEMDSCDEALKSLVGIRTHLFRPPRGAWNPIIFHEAALRRDHIVLWSAALEHQATPLPQDMAARVLSMVKPGAIILMHDGANTSRESTVQALPILLNGLRTSGYKCVTVPEMLGILGDEPVQTNRKPADAVRIPPG